MYPPYATLAYYAIVIDPVLFELDGGGRGSWASSDPVTNKFAPEPSESIFVARFQFWRCATGFKEG